MISVIVPVYNVEPYLRRCVDSIIAQTYKDLEIILVDDGSSDNCGKICDEYAAADKRIKVIHKENGGLSSARNAGIDASTGDYIAFVDSDDKTESNMYEELLEIMQKKHADIVVCNYQFGQWKPFDSGKIYEHTGREAALCIINDDRMGPGISVSVYDKLFDKKCFATARFNEKLYITEDTECMVKVIYEANLVVKLDKTLYYYCQDSCSLMRSKYNVKKAYSEIACYESLYSYFKEKQYSTVYTRIAQMYSDKLFYNYLMCRQEDGEEFDTATKVISEKIKNAVNKKVITFRDNKKAYIKHIIFCFSPALFRYILEKKRSHR